MSNAKDLPVNIHDQRLLACAALVRNDNPNFDMAAWRCGTAYCAVGWYAQSRVGEMRLENTVYGVSPTLEIAHPDFIHPFRAIGWLAVEAEFDVKHQDALYLFCPDRYNERPTREVVARRIEAFVAQRIAARETAHV